MIGAIGKQLKVKEKRSAPRVKEQFPIKISAAGKVYSGLSCDVSLNGLACTSRIPLPVSTPVKIDLLLPEAGAAEKEIMCQAQVVRLESPAGEGEGKDYRLAFNFGGMSKKSRQKLEKFISQRLEHGTMVGEEAVTAASISHNGITCKSATFIPPFREVEVNLVLPREGQAKGQKGPIQCSGVVVKCEPEEGGGGYKVELYFTDIATRDRLRLRQYLKRNQSYHA